MCNEADLPLPTNNLTQLLLNITNPQSGIFEYQGVAGVSWENTTYHKFKTIGFLPSGPVYQYLYFDKTTLNIRFVEEEGLVFYSEKGFVPKSFTAHDLFVKPCTPPPIDYIAQFLGMSQKQVTKKVPELPHLHTIIV